MSKTMNNPKVIATQDAPENAGVTPTQIADNADFPHSGLIKVLNLTGQGNYATSGFNATNVGATGITFSEGTIFRQGKKITVNQGSTQTLTVPSSVTNSYHLVVNQQGTTDLRLRSGGTANIVPAFTADDVIVAVLKHTGSDPMQIQYLTFNQTENSVSIARESGGTYTEGLTIQSNAGDIEIEAKEADKDIIFKGNDSNGGGAGQEIMRIDSADKRVGIGTNAPVAPLHVMTSNTDETLRLQSDDATATTAPDLIFFRNSASPAASDGIGHIKFLGKNASGNDIMYGAIYGSIRDTTAGQEDGSVIITTETNGQDRNRIAVMPTEVNINDNGEALNFRVESDGDANMLFVDGTNDRVGIGTDAPATMFHLKSSGTGQPKVTLENNNDDSQEPQLEFKKNGTSPANSDDLGIIRFVGDDSNGSSHLYAFIMSDAENVTAGAEEGRIFFFVSKAGTTVEMLGISHDEIVVNEAGGDTNFRVESDTNANMLFVDAGNNRVGIGTNTPSASLEVATGGTFRSPRLPMVSVSASTTLTEATHAGAYLKCNGNVTLPATSTEGEHYTILNTTGGNITVGRNTNDINGASSDITVATYNAVTCIAIGGNDWIALGV